MSSVRTGGVLPMMDIQVVKLLKYNTASDYFLMGTELMFIAFTIYYLIQECRTRIFTENKGKVVAARGGNTVIYSIPCRAGCFAPGLYEEKDELQHDDIKKRMNSSYASNRPGA